eukprot:scaffold15.g4204.t1
MGVYSAAAHRAARAVEVQGDAHSDCVVPANNLVHAFLLEARKVRQQLAARKEDAAQDSMEMQLRRAAESLRTHPFRVHDAASAQEVKFVGAAIARIIAQDLFSTYPPEPLSLEEQEERRQQKESLKAAAVKQRKRKANGGPALATSLGGYYLARGAGPGSSPLAAFGSPAALGTARARAAAGAVGGAAEREGEEEVAAAAGGGRKKAKRGAAEPKPPKEYIPRIGSANYAFLVVLLQAQKGHVQREYLGKAEVMELAEASGLPDKPIQGEGNPAQGRQNPRAFYDGWSCFNKQLVNQHGLARKWSNPLKVALTEKGFALAERLYRDGVARGRIAPDPAIPHTGPLLFQLQPPTGAAAAAPAPELRLGMLPSAALRPQAGPEQRLEAAAAPLPASRQRGVAQETAGAGSWQQQQEEAQLQRWQQQDDYYGEDEEEDEGEDEDLRLALSARLQHLEQRVQQPARGPLVRQQRTTAAPRVSPAPPRSRTAASESTEIIDLASSSDEGEPMLQQWQQQQQQEGLPQVPHGAVGLGGASGLVSDADLTLMVEMGYSDRRAKKALRRSLGDISQAVELAEVLTSGSETEGSREGGPAAPEAAGVGGEELGGQRPPRARRQASRGAAALWRALADSSSSSSTDSGAESDHMFVDAEEELPRGGALEAVAAAVAAPPSQPPRAAAAAAAHQRACAFEAALWAPPAAAATAVVPKPNAPVLDRQPSQQLQQAPPSRMGGGAGSVLPSSQGSEWPSQNQGRGHLRALGPQAADNLAGSQAALGGSAGAGGSGSSGSAGGAWPLRVDPASLPLPPLAPGRRFSQEYKVVLVVDTREQYSRAGHGSSVRGARAAHISQMRAAGQAVATAQLGVGDAMWVAAPRGMAGGGDVDPASCYVLDFVDLIQSIRDKNRYLKQKYFLKRCGVGRVFYLLEGELDHNSTFRLYQQLSRAISALYAPLAGALGAGGGPAPAPAAPTLAAFNKRCQQENSGQLALCDVWAIMLSAVPGVGPAMALAIVRAYPTPLLLWDAYLAAARQAEAAGRAGDAAAALMLASLKTDRGHSSTVGPTRSRQVFASLFAARWEQRRR